MGMEDLEETLSCLGKAKKKEQNLSPPMMKMIKQIKGVVFKIYLKFIEQKYIINQQKEERVQPKK